MPLGIYSEVPNFALCELDSVEIDFREFNEGSWVVLFSYPSDFTPICSTEILELARNREEFARRNCKVIGISMDSRESHQSWIKDLQRVSNVKIDFPLVADERAEVLRLLGLSIEKEANHSTKRRKVSQGPVRGLYIIDPHGSVEYVQIMPHSTGRSVSEILRVLDSLQLSSLRTFLGTPAEWQSGHNAVLLSDSVDEKEVGEIGAIQSVFPYLKFIQLESKT